jgi:hypothetical protein
MCCIPRGVRAWLPLDDVHWTVGVSGLCVAVLPAVAVVTVLCPLLVISKREDWLIGVQEDRPVRETPHRVLHKGALESDVCRRSCSGAEKW